MTLLFLSRLYYPHVGGVEKHLKKISEILSKKHKIIIVTEQYDPKLPEYEKYPEADVYRIPINGISETAKKWVIWKWFNRHQDLVKNADIIHAHDVFFWILPLRFKYLNHKYFLTFHGYEGSKAPGLNRIFWHKLGEQLTSGNISIGNFIPKWYHTNASIISYGAVDNTYLPVKKYDLNRVIYLGRLAADTGIMDYLKAAGDLRLQIDVYGDGPLLVFARKYAEKNNIKAVFYGFVPDADKFLPKYKFAFVSRYLGILEALSAQVPVFAHYDSPIKKDYLQLAPFSDKIYICGSALDIRAAFYLFALHQDEALSRAKAGYNWVITQTWPKLAGEYERLWQVK
jgi:glycosyltransferase involved in cell wall biosynthesis